MVEDTKVVRNFKEIHQALSNLPGIFDLQAPEKIALQLKRRRV
ncbi:MAG: hypothetical protein V1681_06200 [Candidatus Neomarinimicrobiota bacterium]